MHKIIKKTKLDGEESSTQECLIWSRFLKSNILGIFYSGSIDTFTFQFIAEELNDYDPNDSKKFILFLESGGGNAALVKCFYPMMASMGMKGIVGFSQTSSAAFQLMLECKLQGLPVYIDSMCNILIHRCSCTTILEQRYDRIKEYNEKWIKTTEVSIDKTNEYLFSKLDKKLKKNYDAGLNIYLLGQDLINYGIFKEYKEGIF